MKTLNQRKITTPQGSNERDMKTISRSEPKARKDHRCDFCNGVIPKGETYKHQSNVFDGKIYQWKSHFRCTEIADKLNMYDDVSEGLTGDDFQETIVCRFDELEDIRIGEGHFTKDYKRPPFDEVLDTVCAHYLTKTP